MAARLTCPLLVLFVPLNELHFCLVLISLRSPLIGKKFGYELHLDMKTMSQEASFPELSLIHKVLEFFELHKHIYNLY